MTQCPDCGARYDAEGDSCRERFDILLALDHSRREPWGSRHGLAFASFALQHPATFPQSLDRSWSALYAIYVGGRAQDFVFRTLVAGNGTLPAAWIIPARPAAATSVPLFTIADLAEFDASIYAGDLDRMCRAALAMWGESGTHHEDN